MGGRRLYRPGEYPRAQQPGEQHSRTYAEAAGVLVWLGTDNYRHDGRKCLDFFTELAVLIASDPDGKAIKVCGGRGSKSISGVDISKQRATSIYCILSHKTVVQASMDSPGSGPS